MCGKNTDYTKLAALYCKKPLVQSAISADHPVLESLLLVHKAEPRLVRDEFIAVESPGEGRHRRCLVEKTCGRELTNLPLPFGTAELSDVDDRIATAALALTAMQPPTFRRLVRLLRVIKTKAMARSSIGICPLSECFGCILLLYSSKAVVAVVTRQVFAARIQPSPVCEKMSLRRGKFSRCPSSWIFGVCFR